MKWFGFCASRKVDQRLTEEEKRKHRCCFTGHRPEKLTKTETEIKDALKHQIDQAIHEGVNVFITGMARGVDLWAAEIVLSLRKKNAEIKLICAIPYDGVDARWPERWRQLYSYVLNQADLVRIIGKCYSYEVFQIRNEWMVNHSSIVIAVFNGSNGGTKNTIDYAYSQGIPVNIIEG